MGYFSRYRVDMGFRLGMFKKYSKRFEFALKAIETQS
jgi:hypothetical protein